MITYTVADYTADDSSVEVTFTNADGFIHKRKVNIPKLPEGGVDSDYFQEILEGVDLQEFLESNQNQHHLREVSGY